MKFVPLLVALTLLGAVASGASAASRSTATADDLCSLARGVSSSLLHSGATVTPSAGASITSLEAELKATYTHIKSAEGLILANSPGSLKPHFVKVFAFDNMIYAELSKANWNILAFAKNAKSLEAGATKIKPDLLAIKAYFDKCKK